jgi:hypothetical protein
MSLNASLLDVVQFKGHRLEVYGDALSLSKKVDPQIAIEPFAFGPLLGLKNMGRLKSNGLSAKFQHHFWYGSNLGLLAATHPHNLVRFASARPAFHLCSRPNIVPLIRSRYLRTAPKQMMALFRNKDQKRTLMPPLATMLCCVLEDSATFRFGLPDTKSRTSPRKPKNRNNR